MIYFPSLFATTKFNELSYHQSSIFLLSQSMLMDYAFAIGTGVVALLLLVLFLRGSAVAPVVEKPSKPQQPQLTQKQKKKRALQKQAEEREEAEMEELVAKEIARKTTLSVDTKSVQPEKLKGAAKGPHSPTPSKKKSEAAVVKTSQTEVKASQQSDGFRSVGSPTRPPKKEKAARATGEFEEDEEMEKKLALFFSRFGKKRRNLSGVAVQATSEPQAQPQRGSYVRVKDDFSLQSSWAPRDEQ